ncbi:MAG: hypothetical protein AABY40_03050 [Nanoarchaeota archaeon]
MTKEEKKKLKTVEDIIADYQKYHHKAGKEFKDRIKKFEEFHDSDNIHAVLFSQHAHYTVFGKPGKEKEYPGAFNEAYKKLDKHLKEDDDKLEDEDKLAEILETYTDTFLQKALGNGYKKTVEHAQKEAKLSKKDLRELKGTLMARYLPGEGRLNILHDSYIKEQKGKKKVELIKELQNLGQLSVQHYTAHLTSSALEGLLSDEDRTDMAKYVTPIFEERGWKNKRAHITRTIEEQQQHFSHLLQGDNDDLKKAGYKVTKYQKKDKDKK